MSELKRTYGSFEAVGVFNVYGKTPEEKAENLKKVFEINQTSKNKKVYSRMNLSLNCGKDRLSFATISGTQSQGVEDGFFVHSKDDFSKTYRIEWAKRYDNSLLEDISFNDYIYVGLERGINSANKPYTIAYKFLSPYDAVEYISKVLTDGQVLHVKGKLSYSIYEDKLTIKKIITSITLAFNSKGQVPSVDEYYATFKELVLLDINSCPNQEEDGLYPINGYVNVGITNDEKKTEIITVPHTIYASKTEIPKWIEVIAPKYLRPASPLDIHLTEVLGHFSFSRVETEEPNILELADAEKFPQFADLINMYQDGLVTEEELIGKMVIGNKSKETMLFLRPTTIYDKATEKEILNINKTLYKVTDLDLRIADLSQSASTPDDRNDKVDEEVQQAFSKSVFGKPMQNSGGFGQPAPQQPQQPAPQVSQPPQSLGEVDTSIGEDDVNFEEFYKPFKFNDK